VIIEISDITRKVVKTLVNENQSIGLHVINFDKSSLSAGVYFLTIKNRSGIQSKKVVILE